MAEAAFWTCAALVAYTYALYPAVLFVAYAAAQVRRDLRYLTGPVERRRAAPRRPDLPRVSLVVPAFNEEAVLHGKLENIRALEYPRHALEVVIVSDGSADRTNAILAAASADGIRSVVLHERQGKAAAINAGVAASRHEVLVFSDASTLFAPDAVLKLVRHFAEPRVGVVCGSLRFQGNDVHRQTEGLYWRYESALRLMEARLGATLTASGAIYAVRRSAFETLATDVVIDDFVIPMSARRLGYRVLSDPEAHATELAAASVEDEFTRRVRLAMGSFRALTGFLSVPLDAVTYLAFVSHKVLRWILPLLLGGLLLASALLSGRPFYRAVLAIQAAFYVWAGFGWLFRQRLQNVRYALVGYFLVAMHLAFVVGFMRVVAGQHGVRWKRVA